MAVVLLFAGCNGGSSEGQAGGHCYANGTCNVTLSCIGGYCVATLDAPRPDAPVDAPRDAHVDAPPDAFPCNNDSATEPNNSVATAYALPSPLTPNPFTLSSLAICPDTDKDFFSVVLMASSQELKADVTYDASGAPLSGAVLNAGGTPIKIMTPLVGSPDTIEGDLGSLPAGMYFVAIYSSSGVNNYSLTVAVI